MSSAGIVAAAGGVAPPWTNFISSLAPYSWYKMDEAAGTTLVDAGSTPVNGATAGSNITHNQPSLIPGNSSGKSKITANGGNIDTGVISRDTNVGYTIFTTWKATPANVVGNGRWLDAGGPQIAIGATDIQLVAWNGPMGTPASLGPRAALLDGNPHFVAIVLKDTDQKLYLDGVLHGSAAAGGVPHTGSALHRWARAGGSDYFSGAVDGFVFCAGVLPPSTIAAAYASWVAPAP